MGVALRGLLGRKLRSALTAFAVVVGVAMVSGSFILTDTIDKSFDAIYDDSYANADAVISSKQAIAAADGESDSPGFPATVLEQVRRLPSVAAAAGSVSGTASLVGRDGDPIGRWGGTGVSVDPSAEEALTPLRLAAGRWPHGAREIAIDKNTADEEGFGVGDTIGAYADGPARTYRISGIVRFGSADSIPATIAAFDLPTAQALFHKRGQLDEIQIDARPSTSPAELVEGIRPLLPETAEVKTAAAQAADASAETAKGLAFFRNFLLVFGAIALFVGSFVIANTASITVAQRMRELATLRTLGASRRQVLASVVLESVVVGLIASVAGLFLGLALAQALNALLAAIGVELTGDTLVFSTRTIVVSLLVGTVISLLASLRPALRATRVPAIAAVREGATLPQSRHARRAVFVAGATIAGAVALLSYGVFADGVGTAPRLLLLGAGVLLLFVGVTLSASRLVRPLAAVLGAPGARIGGVAGALARDNATRNPGRTASTAAALMIGLALITTVSVLGEGVRQSFVEAVDKQFVADYALATQANLLTDEAARAAARADGVTAVSGVRTGTGEWRGKSVPVSGVDANLTEVIEIDWHRGSDRLPAELGRDGAFVERVWAREHGLQLGSRLRLKTPTGTTVPLRIEGIINEPEGGTPFGEIVISTATFDRSFAGRDNQYTLVNMRGGVTAGNTARLEQALTAFPQVEVQTRDEFKKDQLGEAETLLNLIYALLALSVIVSLFGIVNTLVLSVFERTRELGMLRAIGMTRRQVRRMIRHESVVTALIGATLGIAIGLFLAALVTRALSGEGVVFAIPYGSLVAFVGAAIAAGVLAAILPARRASRLNVLRALQYE